MLMTKDSEDGLDRDREVAYHVCPAGRECRDDVERIGTIANFSLSEFSVGFTL
mgnify:CR=1 FL=1